jgi:predicted PurR-regulated permease PerM
MSPPWHARDGEPVAGRCDRGRLSGVTDAPPPGSARRWRMISERLQARRRELEEAEALLEAEALRGRTAAAVDEALAARAAAEPVHVVVQAPPPAEREPAVSYGMGLVAAWSWRLLVVAAATALVAWGLWQVRTVTIPLAVAVLLAAFLHAPVARLRRWGWGRTASTVTVFVGSLLLVLGVLTIAGRSLGGQFDQLRDQAVAGVDEIRRWLVEGPWRVSEAQIQHWFDRIGETINENSDAITSGALSTASMAVEVIAGLALALFATFFFLYDGAAVWAWTVRLLPRAAEARADHAGRLAWVTLTGYVRGTVLVAAFDGLFITILLLVLQVPLAIPLGVLVFFGAFVPLVGAFVTGALAVLVALVTVSPVTALLVLAGIVAVQQLEAHIFQPLVLGRLVRLHPLAVVIAISIGAILAGIPGAVVAVPLVAVLNTVGTYLAGGMPPLPERPAAEDVPSVDQPAGPASRT